jgi:hypothetical protein
MGYPRKRNWIARLPASGALLYGLDLVSVVTLGLAHTFVSFHFPQPFTAFALSAIAITFWYGTDAKRACNGLHALNHLRRPATLHRESSKMQPDWGNHQSDPPGLQERYSTTGIG